MDNYLNFSIQTVENTIYIKVSGPLQIDLAKKFQASLLYLVQKGVNRIIIDLSQIVDIDYSCGAFLQKIKESMEKTERKIAFILPISPQLQPLLENLNLKETLPWFKNIHEAISYFDKKSIEKIEDVISTIYEGMVILIEDSQTNKKYSSLVLKKYEGTLWINWPKDKNKNLITLGEEVRCLFLKKEGIFEFKTPIHKKLLEPQPTLVLKRPTTSQQVEIRSFYRYPTKLITQFRIFYDTKPPSEQLFMGICTDLSAGGIQLESQSSVNQYDYLLLYLQLPGYSLNNIIGKVVRVSEGENGKFIYGVKFTAIFEVDRLKIENYILDRMDLKEIK